MWVPVVDHGYDKYGAIVVEDTPIRWVLAVEFGCWLTGKKGLGRIGYKWLLWASGAESTRSREVFRVPLTEQTHRGVMHALEELANG